MSQGKRIFIDCGGHDGCSVVQFLSGRPDFSCVTFEPNEVMSPYYRFLPTRLVKKAVSTHDGTVEFIVDQNDNFYFIEVNARIQVEHPVTEEITGIDLMQLMLRTTSGEKLPFTQEDITLKGHAIEARITAQDPDNDFSPSTGKITGWRAPMGRGVRMESHCYAGLTVTPFYDPLLAKLIVRGETRAEAVSKLQAALHEFEVEGIATNIPFLRRLAATPSYVEGNFDTGFIPKFLDGEAV